MQKFRQYITEAKAPRWKKAGPNGEIEATIGGHKYKIEKALDFNERHRGEFHVYVWDRGAWQWENTLYGKDNAKNWIMSTISVQEGSGSETWEAGYKRRVVKTTSPEHKEQGYSWRIKGKDVTKDFI